MSRFAALALLLGLSAEGQAFPPPVERPRVSVPRSTATLVADGRLDEPAWTDAAALTPFVQVEPDQLKPAKLATSVRVLATSDGLWIGARCDDDEGTKGVQQTDLRRDFSLSRGFDWFGVVLDPLGDGRNAFGWA